MLSLRFVVLFNHIVAVIVALGGSLFSTFALAPVLAAKLDPPTRLRVSRRIVRRRGYAQGREADVRQCVQDCDCESDRASRDHARRWTGGCVTWPRHFARCCAPRPRITARPTASAFSNPTTRPRATPASRRSGRWDLTPVDAQACGADRGCFEQE